MTTQQVALLRAVNVGKRRVEMARLRTELEDLGFDDVWTYINSGNAIFRSDRPASELEALIEARLDEVFGFTVETFVRTARHIQDVAERSPFGTIAPGTTHLVAFVRDAPDAEGRAAIEALSGPSDQLQVIDAEVHWWIDGKSLDTALKPRDWKQAGATLNTTRNTTMLRKLSDRLSP